MKTIILILATLLFTSCASEQTIAYEKARYEANPNYQADSIDPAIAAAINRSADSDGYFACLYKYNQKFSNADAMWICH